MHKGCAIAQIWCRWPTTCSGMGIVIVVVIGTYV